MKFINRLFAFCAAVTAANALTCGTITTCSDNAVCNGNACGACNEGYTGDGTTCNEVPQPQNNLSKTPTQELIHPHIVWDTEESLKSSTLLRELLPTLSKLGAKKEHLEEQKELLLKLLEEEKHIRANSVFSGILRDVDTILKEEGVDLSVCLAEAVALKDVSDSDAMKMISMWTTDNSASIPIVVSSTPPLSRRRRFFGRSDRSQPLKGNAPSSLNLGSTVMGFTDVTLCPTDSVRQPQGAPPRKSKTQDAGRISGLKTPFALTEARYPLSALPVIGFGSATSTKQPTPAGQLEKARLPVQLEMEVALENKSLQEQIAKLLSSGPTQASSELPNVPETQVPSAELPTQADTWIWLANFMESLMNNADVHLMRIAYEMTMLSRGCMDGTNATPDKTWGRTSGTGYEGRWKMWSDSYTTFVLKGTLDANLIDVFSLIYEADLHKTWIPFVGKSQSLHRVSELSQVIRHYTKLPWPLHDKETLVLGVGADALLEEEFKSIIMTGLSVPADAGGLWGFLTHSPSMGVDRMDINHFALSLSPSTENKNKTVLSLFLYVKTNLITPPKSLQNMLGRTACSKMFSTLKKMCDTMEGSDHQKQQNLRPEFYSHLRQRYEEFWRANHS